MKLPDSLWEEDYTKIRALWETAALQISLEAGVYVVIGVEFFGDDKLRARRAFKRIYFKVEGHEFESLQAVRKALNLKAFL